MRTAWEADTLPAELLPLGRSEILAPSLLASQSKSPADCHPAAMVVGPVRESVGSTRTARGHVHQRRRRLRRWSMSRIPPRP